MLHGSALMLDLHIQKCRMLHTYKINGHSNWCSCVSSHTFCFSVFVAYRDECFHVVAGFFALRRNSRRSVPLNKENIAAAWHFYCTVEKRISSYFDTLQHVNVKCFLLNTMFIAWHTFSSVFIAFYLFAFAFNRSASSAHIADQFISTFLLWQLYPDVNLLSSTETKYFIRLCTQPTILICRLPFNSFMFLPVKTCFVA